MASIVPMAPFTRLTSTQRLLVSISWADLARHTSPPASSDGGFGCIGSNVVVAVGWPESLSLAQPLPQEMEGTFVKGVRSYTLVGVCSIQSAVVACTSLNLRRMFLSVL